MSYDSPNKRALLLYSLIPTAASWNFLENHNIQALRKDIVTMAPIPILNAFPVDIPCLCIYKPLRKLVAVVGE